MINQNGKKQLRWNNKTRLVAQGFSQRLGIDYEETYSSVMDTTTSRFLISLVIREGFDLRLMDVVTAYLYGPLDNNIYMKLQKGFKLPEAANSCSREHYSIKLNRFLYGLKQSGHLLRKFGSRFVIIVVYVDDLNIIRTPKEILKNKILSRLQIEHLNNGILVHQTTYIEKVLRRFYMHNTHPLSTLMVFRSLDVNKDPFHPRENDEDFFGTKVPYLSYIGALVYLANHIRPNISFSVNLLATFSSCPTRRHWNGVQEISGCFSLTYPKQN
ncbi:Retrovirus-related Pol polyprotein from transposon TNT 1-94 [Gossypium australe]|uniref:Retrovirus-related Pol polyprotein from transposon TNT 1-94 n=1 Tax=Gossypium australe TaxID=47621 RepID=A0A5B6W6S7_9ROSI|nr:Retrovirus-related Pol polyprotein from transposon TNT 1-94 [Gossypium australe]